MAAEASFLRGLVIGALCLAPSPPAWAQEIRRAEPVQAPPARQPLSPDQIENPAWMERIRPAPGATPFRPAGYEAPAPSSEAPPAQPATPSEYQPGWSAPPSATQSPQVRRALPIEAAPAPVTQPATPPQSPPPAQPGTAAPQPAPGAVPTSQQPPPPGGVPQPPVAPGQQGVPGSPALRQPQSPKQIADAFYARRMFDLAIPEYENFLRTAPTGPERAAAWFRLGECLRQLGQDQDARSAYERLLRETPNGEFAGAAAYRLASHALEQEWHQQAAQLFELAARESAEPAVRLSATFFAGRSYELLNDRRRAIETFERVLSLGGQDSRYEEYSLATLGRLCAELGRATAAANYYRQLASKTTNPALRSEALLKAAQALLDAKKPAEARPFLEDALAKAHNAEARAVARLGLMEIDAAENNQAALAAVPLEEIAALPPASQPRALLLVANALRNQEQFAQALPLYQRLISEFPQSESARQARFQRLVCLYRQNDPALPQALQEFLATATDPAEIAQARMLQAETLFTAARWAEAAEAFGALTNARLPDRLMADALFKHAWARAQAGQPAQAVQAYSLFLERFPGHELTPRALIGRGLAHLENGGLDAAIRDFDNVLQNFPSSPQREIALLQRALAFGARRDYTRMREDFEQFIREFPESQARAQAEFWIGYAKFEDKDYAAALPHLEEARQRDPAAYGPRANLRILLANYYLNRPRDAARELESREIPNVPAEVYSWLAGRLLEEGDFAGAERYLNFLLEGKAGDAPGPDLFTMLARARLAQKKFPQAAAAAQSALQHIHEPAPRARTLLLLAEARLGENKFAEALEATSQAQLLQPEGRINAEARILSGRIHSAQGQFAEAAKLFMTVAVLYDDETLSAEALRRAAAAYNRAGNPPEAEKALQELRQRYPSAPPEPLEG